MNEGLNEFLSAGRKKESFCLCFCFERGGGEIETVRMENEFVITQAVTQGNMSLSHFVHCHWKYCK